MRTNQYAYLLVAQVLMACLLVGFGPTIIDGMYDVGGAGTSEVQQPGDQGQGGLLEHLRR